MEYTEKSEYNFRKECNNFRASVAKARKLKNLPDLHHHDLTTYCQTLINGCSLFQLIHSMECSDRFDLVENNPDESKAPIESDLILGFKAFCSIFLGLQLVIQGDPRGSAFKLVVDSTLGNSFGDHTHLCVPSIDCYWSM